MKKSLKIAFSLLGLSSTLLVTSVPLVTSCTTSTNRSSVILKDEEEPIEGNASDFINNATGKVWYTIDGNNITISGDPSMITMDVTGTDIEFIDEPNIDGKTYYLTEIGNLTFKKLPVYTGKFTGSVTFNKSLSVIGNGAFQGQSEVTKYDFSKITPSFGISIGESAFYKNTSLTEVKTGDNLSSNVIFGTNCFEQCLKLSTMNFPTGTHTIDDYAFKDCSTLSTVTFANTDTSSIEAMTIGNGIFDGCTSLTKIQVPTNTKSSYEKIFAGKLPENVIIEESYTPTPPPQSSIWTPGTIAGITIACVLIAVGIALAIALPILKKQGKIGKKKRTSYKDPLEAEDKALKEQKYEVGKIIPNRKCPYCKKPLIVKKNKKGQKFIGCTNFPKCKYTESIEDEVRDFPAEKMK